VKRLWDIHVSVEVVLTPWTWELAYFRRGLNLQVLFGPVQFTVIDG
jgi:hypothetical protein